jgi:hypothetical protein
MKGEENLRPDIGTLRMRLCFMDVIEHLVDAEKLMIEVVEINPRVIFITIPNIGFLSHRARLIFAGRFPMASIFDHIKNHRFWTVKDFYEWAGSVRTIVVSHHGLVDRGDFVASWAARSIPGSFAHRMIYELSVMGNSASE